MRKKRKWSRSSEKLELREEQEEEEEKELKKKEGEKEELKEEDEKEEEQEEEEKGGGGKRRRRRKRRRSSRRRRMKRKEQKENGRGDQGEWKGGLREEEEKMVDNPSHCRWSKQELNISASRLVSLPKCRQRLVLDSVSHCFVGGKDIYPTPSEANVTDVVSQNFHSGYQAVVECLNFQIKL